MTRHHHPVAYIAAALLTPVVLSGCVAPAAATASPPPTTGTRYREISGAAASHLAIDPTTWELTAGGRRYPCVLKNEPPQAPWIAQDGFDGDPTSVAVRLGPTAQVAPPQCPPSSIANAARDKVNYTFVPGSDPLAPQPGQQRYLGFAVKLDPASETPRDGTDYVIAQWWQGSPMPPPLSLQLLPNSGSGGPGWAFVAHNEDHHFPHNGITLPRVGGPELLQPGVWHTFVVGTVFGDHSGGGSGSVDVWMDGVQVVQWTGDLGYVPGRPVDPADGPYHVNPGNRLSLYFGPYRDRLTSTQTMYFDRLRYADTRELADPHGA
ncbi:heparin lyase I family protein [Kitasatospora sp. NPDC093102]|uniref:heparin lyase I family protein n=1 Tax=Kitasatospora sp. NPDC093102 TaxID=3155069 RepID=UPI0034277BD0